MALDADEDWVYFCVGATEAASHLAPGVKIEAAFGPRNMGAGPNGIARMNMRTGEVRHVVSVPFQIGHIQANLWNPGEIVFCWETGGKSPQRTWTVLADGSGLRPLYPEAPYEWVTHEAVISKDEVAMAIMGHRQIAGGAGGVDGPATGVGGANPGQDERLGRNRHAREAERPRHRQPAHARDDHRRPNAIRQRLVACAWLVATAAGRLATISAAAST
jgi:oligogalacturonide lyase